MRVTLDKDYVTPLDILMAWNNLLQLQPDRVRGRLSSSGDGVHLEATGVETEDPKAIHLRRVCGDDPWRIELDIRKYWRPSQAFWDRKAGRSAGSWVDDPESLIRELER